MRGATYQAVAEANTDWLAMLATHPALGELLRRGWAGDTTLTERETGTGSRALRGAGTESREAYRLYAGRSTTSSASTM